MVCAQSTPASNMPEGLFSLWVLLLEEYLNFSTFFSGGDGSRSMRR